MGQGYKPPHIVRLGDSDAVPEEMRRVKEVIDLLKTATERIMLASPPGVSISALVNLTGQHAEDHARCYPEAADIWIEMLNVWIARLETLSRDNTPRSQ